MNAEANIHAVCLVVGERGVLIRGPSGSGKSTLALALIGRASAAGMFASVVADDRVLVAEHSGRLVAGAPLSIAGLVEVFGLGPRHVETEFRAVVDLVVELTSAKDAPRLSDDPACVIAGCELPLLMLAERNAAGSDQAILAWLGWPPFVSTQPLVKTASL